MKKKILILNDDFFKVLFTKRGCVAALDIHTNKMVIIKSLLDNLFGIICFSKHLHIFPVGVRCIFLSRGSCRDSLLIVSCASRCREHVPLISFYAIKQLYFMALVIPTRIFSTNYRARRHKSTIVSDYIR